MNKAELVEAVAAQRQITRQRAVEALEALLGSMVTALERDERVQIKGFGSFATRTRKARTGRNPRTGEAVQIPARRAVVFKASKALQAGLAPGGPAEPAPAAATEEDLGRRRHLRAPVELRVEYFLLDKFIADYTRNISRGGIFIRSAQQLEVGTELVFKLHVPPLEEPLELRGRVAWVRTAAAGSGAAAGMGIEFVYASEAQRLQTVRTVEALIEGEEEAPAPEEPRGRPEGEALAGAAPRRKHPRLPLVLRIDYETVDQFVTEYTRNISTGGVFIRTERLLPIGTEFIFQLHVPGQEEPVELKGRVAWVRTAAQAARSAADAGMGVSFVYASEEERIVKQSIIGDILRRHRS